jgi:tetratricopeptide (TPR) repeat protein
MRPPPRSDRPIDALAPWQACRKGVERHAASDIADCHAARQTRIVARRAAYSILAKAVIKCRCRLHNSRDYRQNGGTMRTANALLLLSAVVAVPAGCKRNRAETPKESVVVVFRDDHGRTLTMDELHGLTGTFQYEIVGKSHVPPEAETLHKQARQAGESGDYKKAITLLNQAHKLAPQWPYPLYDLAYTYLLMDDTENARKYYRKTVESSPRGFFTAITALDTLDREEQGELPAKTYLAYLSLEWTDDSKKKAEMVQQLIKRAPAFAPGWKELAVLSEGDPTKLSAIEKGLAAKPDAETKGVLQINKALILDRKGDHDGAIRMLGELVLDPASTYGTEHLAKATLAYVAKK